jgi:hypothetical protein
MEKLNTELAQKLQDKFIKLNLHVYCSTRVKSWKLSQLSQWKIVRFCLPYIIRYSIRVSKHIVRVHKTATVAVFKFSETGSVNRPNRPVSRKARFHRHG